MHSHGLKVDADLIQPGDFTFNTGVEAYASGELTLNSSS